MPSEQWGMPPKKGPPKAIRTPENVERVRVSIKLITPRPWKTYETISEPKLTISLSICLKKCNGLLPGKSFRHLLDLNMWDVKMDDPN
ncbi:hypothetical protein TNCV_1156701 [Trichonephila clavipes]|nr:hypothetical protein TNCV_1156701 [Trichonephila clavipes]